jgi:hypothetical protein
VRNSIGHSLAPVFEVYPGDARNSFPAYKYWTRISLGSIDSIDRVELTNVTDQMTLAIDRIALYDSTTRLSTALSLSSGPIDFDKWQPVFDENGVMILRNNSALPRTWVVAEAEAVEEDQALHRIRGEDQPFDPRKTVLLEVKPNELPRLPGGPVSPGAAARLTAYEPNRLQIETECSTPAVLVVSEISYPGWEATIDGQRAAIHTANYLLRAVALPAGSHQVEMRYTAPAARNGALLSGLTIVLMISVGVYARLGRKY